MTKKPSVYDKLETLVWKRGEETFPFSCYRVNHDWDGISEEWLKIKEICKKAGIRLGWHGEL